MRLLFDQNISPKLTSRLADIYFGSEHVADVGLGRATDQEVWSYAEQSRLAIVSKDSDFSEMSVLRGFPPKVIWIRRGNCATDEIEEMLRDNYETLERFGEDPETGVLMLY